MHFNLHCEVVMSSAIAMVNPATGAGGALIAICLFFIAPSALILHVFVRRFFLICFSISGIFTLLLVAL